MRIGVSWAAFSTQTSLNCPMEKAAEFKAKKKFPTASTMTRQLGAWESGTVTACVPSLETLEARSAGKVFPPSVESLMLTLLTFTPLPVVPATFQVMVSWEPGVQTTPSVAWEVTLKGPAPLVTVTATSSVSTWPASALLSRTVSLKFSCRETRGVTSQVEDTWPWAKVLSSGR